MSHISPHCSACPLSDHAACPSIRHPSWCKNAERERRQPDPRQHYWLEAIRREAEKLAGSPVLVKVPPGFPAMPDPSDTRVKVGVLSPCCFLGGADIWTGDLLRHSDKSRLRWMGVAIRDEGLPIIPEVRASWEAYAPVAIGPDAIRALAASCDVLVAWGVFHGWGFPAEKIAELIGGTKLLVVSHGADAAHLIPPGELLADAGAAGVSRASLRGLPDGLRGRAAVILNQISPDRVRPTMTRDESRTAMGVPAGKKVAGWLARIASEKRPEVFLRAIGALPTEWVGVMAGIGYGLDEARRLADEVAPGRVIFLGARHDIGDVLSAYDCLCMPSVSEACSLTAGEGWLAGCPLISTPVGMLEEYPGLARIIPANPTGEELARAILADDGDREGTAARAERAMEFARAEMSPECFGKSWSDLICEMAPARPIPDFAHGRKAGQSWAVANPTAAQRDARLAVLRNRCEHASKGDGCGCDGRLTCALGRGTDGRPNVRECFDCLTATHDVGQPA